MLRPQTLIRAPQTLRFRSQVCSFLFNSNRSMSTNSRDTDHFAEIFQGIDPTPSSAGRSRQTNVASAKSRQRSVYEEKSSAPSAIRLSASENAMMETLFRATFANQGKAVAEASLKPLLRQSSTSSSTLLHLYDSIKYETEGQTKSIGENDKLEKVPTVDDILECQTQEMELCSSDHELLQWATKMFNRQQELEGLVASTKMKQKSSTPSPPNEVLKEHDMSILANELAVYPHALKSLIRTFRDKYRNPHLALAIYSQACQLGIYSYVRGCTTSTYNEVLNTLWYSFRDLQAIINTMGDMRINGVAFDPQTRRLGEEIMREAAKEDECLLGSPKGQTKWDFIAQLDNMLGEHTYNLRDGASPIESLHEFVLS